MTIKQKQWQLYFLGYYTGEIDGIWGPKSKEATKKFQSDNNLAADSIFGAKTEAKSIEVIRAIQKAVGATVDGLAGNKTKAATMEYQKKNGLTPDGIAGPLTRAKINSGVVVKPMSDEEFWKTIKYFKKTEFKCKCGGKYCTGYPAELDQDLIKVAERIREHFGAACVVSSGVRCTTHNANVGGITNSRHKQGKAMDFCIKGKTANQVIAFVKKQPEIRYTYVIDSLYVHMDVYWSYYGNNRKEDV